ncbi:MAG: hypothetical protein K9M44_03430 [Candidatus Pacebacteria bacterium]|nr:hypothetical protein [Candidatus Paceibacterota bacterium]
MKKLFENDGKETFAVKNFVCPTEAPIITGEEIIAICNNHQKAIILQTNAIADYYNKGASKHEQRFLLSIFEILSQNFWLHLDNMLSEVTKQQAIKNGVGLRRNWVIVSLSSKG